LLVIEFSFWHHLDKNLFQPSLECLAGLGTYDIYHNFSETGRAPVEVQQEMPVQPCSHLYHPEYKSAWFYSAKYF